MPNPTDLLVAQKCHFAEGTLMNKQLKSLAARLSKLRKDESNDKITDEQFHNGLSAVQDELEGFANVFCIIELDKEEYTHLLDRLFDIMYTGRSLKANIEGEYKDDAGSIADDASWIANILGISLRAEAKKRKAQ
jgi:hypothetical protein